MGVIAITTSGALIYNPLSNRNGSLTSYYEWTTLDPCLDTQRLTISTTHKHAVILHFTYEEYYN